MTPDPDPPQYDNLTREQREALYEDEQITELSGAFPWRITKAAPPEDALIIPDEDDE